MQTRLMTADEPLDDVAALQGEAFHQGWGVEALRRELSGAAGRLYRLDSGNSELVGFCLCWVVADEWHINSLAVAPAWRRQGHARRLLTDVRTQLLDEGVRSATLEVRRSNIAALALYAGLGFVVEGVRRDYYDEPREDALVLWCRSLAQGGRGW